MAERQFVPPIRGCEFCGNAEAPVAYLVNIGDLDIAVCTKCFAPNQGMRLVAFLASFYMDASIFGAYDHRGAVILGILMLVANEEGNEPKH